MRVHGAFLLTSRASKSLLLAFRLGVMRMRRCSYSSDCVALFGLLMKMCAFSSAYYPTADDVAVAVLGVIVAVLGEVGRRAFVSGRSGVDRSSHTAASIQAYGTLEGADSPRPMATVAVRETLEAGDGVVAAGGAPNHRTGVLGAADAAEPDHCVDCEERAQKDGRGKERGSVVLWGLRR